MKLLIPTRNRPHSLKSLLSYIAHFYPGQQILIADGSFADHKQAVHDVIAGIDGLDIELVDYPAELPLIDRYIDVLMRQMDDTLIAPCADDDYPLIDVLAKSAQRLTERADFSGVMAASVILNPQQDGTLRAKLSPCAGYPQKNINKRLRRYGDFHCITNYGVFRTSHMLARMRHFTEGFTIGFGDFEIAITDILNGRFDAAQSPGYLRTNNPHHSKLRSSGVRLSRLDQYPELMRRLTLEIRATQPDLDEDAVTKMADQAIARYIGVRYQRQAVAEAARETIFEAKPVAGQQRFFDDLFSEGTRTRQRYLPQLRWVAQSLANPDLAQDNQGEVSNYENLEDM